MFDPSESHGDARFDSDDAQPVGHHAIAWSRAGPAGNTNCMKGDRVEILVDAGETVRSFEVTASRTGRRLETSTGRGIVEVSEVTRTGQPVRTARFMASRVVAVVEHPASTGRVAGEQSIEGRASGARRGIA